MKNILYEKMYRYYQKGYSLAEVGKMEGMTRQSVHQGFKIRGYKLREKKELPYQIFNGLKFTKRNHGYFSQTDGERELMHRIVWEFYKGKIPPGYDIHHKNHNKSDNRIGNLELYSKSDHAKLFATGNNQHTKK